MHSNGLSHDELERLTCLAEECAEVIQVVGKIVRHGYADSSPIEPYSMIQNRKMLEKELGDLRYWMIHMSKVGDVNKQAIHYAAELKRQRVGQWLHYNLPLQEPLT